MSALNKCVLVLMCMAAALIIMKLLPDKYHPFKDISNPKTTESKLYELVPGKGHLSFLKKPTWKCQELFTKEEMAASPFDNDTMKDLYKEHLNRAKQFNNIEGNSGNLKEQYLTYKNIIKLPLIKTVCETGFNAGHSTFMWLATNPNTTVYSFDIGSHGYSKPMAKFLQDIFPGRLHITWGDSTITLPDFRRKNPDVTCDLAVIDGGHSTAIAQSDFDNFIHMVSLNNVLIFDDTPSSAFTHLGKLWENEKRKGRIDEIFKCSYVPEMPWGLSVGRFIVPTKQPSALTVP